VSAAMADDDPPEQPAREHVLYERMFIDRTFAERAFEDRTFETEVITEDH
jgi:hypothetical protein